MNGAQGLRLGLSTLCPALPGDAVVGLAGYAIATAHGPALLSFNGPGYIYLQGYMKQVCPHRAAKTLGRKLPSFGT